MASGIRFQGKYTFDSTQAIKIPVGTQVQRPSIAEEGDLRFNTDTVSLEIYTGVDWEVPTAQNTTESYQIVNITQASPAQVEVSLNHKLVDGSLVSIVDVVGMTEINSQNYYADVRSGVLFDLYYDELLTMPVDSTAYSAYVSDGTATAGQINSFLGLTDTPTSFNGAGKYARINNSNTGIEFDSLTTDDAVEGTNLFYTDARVTARLNASSIDALSDVVTSGAGHTPTDGQALVWSQSMGHWMPGTVSGGGAGLSNVVDDTTPQLGGDLYVNGKWITSATGNVTLASADFLHLLGSGNHKVSMYDTYFFPSTAPTTGQVLVAGSTPNLLEWGAGGAGGGTPGGAGFTEVQFNNAGAFAGDSNLTYNTTTDTLNVLNINVTGTLSNTASGTPSIVSASDLNLEAETVAGEINLTASNVNINSFLQLKSYTTIQLLAVTGTAGQLIYVSDGDSGAPCMAVWDGTQWARVVLGAAVAGI